MLISVAKQRLYFCAKWKSQHGCIGPHDFEAQSRNFGSTGVYHVMTYLEFLGFTLPILALCVDFSKAVFRHSTVSCHSLIRLHVRTVAGVQIRLKMLHQQIYHGTINSVYVRVCLCYFVVFVCKRQRGEIEVGGRYHH